ncbi:MAG: XRE family transcriptional regulator [Acidimicrobiales bacterium]
MTVGDRIRHVLEYYGWTQKDLGLHLGVTQPRVNQMLGAISLDPSRLDELAAATGFSPDFFSRGPLPDLPEGSLRFRKKARATQRDDDRVRAVVRHTIEAVQLASTVASPPPVRIQSLHDDIPLNEIETVAESAREWLGVGRMDPIANIVRAVERAGVVVVYANAEVTSTDRLDHDGAAFWPDPPVGVPVIYATRGRTGDRTRLTVAHELGHLVLHQYRHPPSVQAAEEEAFRFGSSLIVPADAIHSLRTPITLKVLVEAKARWGMSVQALVKRCYDLNVIDKDRQTSLYKQIASRGWRTAEPVEVPVEEPALMRRLMEAAYGSSDPMRVGKKLGIPAIPTRDLVA